MGESDEVRVIDVGQPQTRFARGWHCLGLADTFRDGKPHGVQAFGTKLVIFEDSAGKLNVLDGYCRHMGGDLTMGTIKGDAVACPFHDWRWSGDGRCRHIPYASRIPPRARTRSWLTFEQNRQLFVWHDPQGNPPPPEVTIPRIEGAFSDEWSDWTWDTILIEGAHCREIMDNVVDMAHFFYIHFGFPTYFKNVFEGHIASQYLTTRGRPDVADDHPVHKLFGPNFWPSEVPEFGQTLIELYRRLDRLGAILLEASAAFIDEPASRFRDMATDSDTIVRVLYYPPVGKDVPPGAVRSAAHEDINLITLLSGATSEGLELKRHDGTWMPVHTGFDTIVVDAGDMLQNVTNGLYKSTTHRVVNPGDASSERFSMPCFIHARAEVDLTPLPSCVARTGGAPRYPSITAGEYLLQRLREIGLA